MENVSPIDEALASRGTPEWHRPVVGKYHASVLPFCVRKSYYRFMEVKGRPDPQGARNMSFGSMIHSWLENEIMPHVKESFTVVAKEEPIFYRLPDTEAMIVGRFDYLVRENSGELALIDAKSSEDLYYINRDGPSDYQAQQLSVYQNRLNIDRGYIWGIGRAKVTDMFVPCPYKQSNFDFMCAQAHLLHSFVVAEEVPPPMSHIGWECNKCEYLDYRGLCPGMPSTEAVVGTEVHAGIELDLGDE